MFQGVLVDYKELQGGSGKFQKGLKVFRGLLGVEDGFSVGLKGLMLSKELQGRSKSSFRVVSRRIYRISGCFKGVSVGFRRL